MKNIFVTKRSKSKYIILNVKKKENEKNLLIDDMIKMDNFEQNALKEQRLDIDERQLLNQTKFKKLYPPKSFVGLTFLAFLNTFFSNYLNPNRQWAKKKLLIRFPIIRMLKNYKKEYILSDFFVGMTVSLKLVLFSFTVKNSLIQTTFFAGFFFSKNGVELLDLKL